MNLRQGVQALLGRFGYRLEKLAAGDAYPVLRPLDRNGIEILADPDFQASCRSLGATTLLDTPRLANLWNLCRLTDPDGAMLEIGTYKGGGALHLSNCCPQRHLLVCDPFDRDSFERLDPAMDQIFHRGQFADTSEEAIRNLLQGRNCTVIRGYFPASVRERTLPPVSFVHLDVDVYEATKSSLLYLLSGDRLCARSLIVLDDFRRRAQGVDQAVAEVLAEVKGTIAAPLFPGQGLVIPPGWR